MALGDLDGGAFSSVANALSRDGTTVVGQSESGRGPEAMRWRRGTGLVGLGGLSSTSFGSNAFDVSANGDVVVGASRSGLVTCPGRVDEAFRWSAPSGMTALGDLVSGCFFSAAYGVSADGSTVVGAATNADGPTAAIWSSGTWRDLGFSMGVDNSSAIDAVTPDVSVAVGTQRLGNSPSYQVFRWQADGGRALLGDLDGGDLYSAALAVSDDGGVIVGFGTSAAGVEALRWSAATGVTSLGDFAGGAVSSQALAMTGDGTLIVGFGTTDGGSQAAVWSTSLAIGSLEAELSSRGVPVPSGWKLISATGVAVNGAEVTFAGNATNASGVAEAWTATYCRP